MPFVTYALIVVNVVVFISYFTRLEDRALMGFFQEWAYLPAEVVLGERLHTLLTAMFLHGDWLHLAGNVLFLWIFGDNLEEFFGHIGFLLFYLVCGVAASALQIAADSSSMVPNIGASGAIAGVMGGYLLLFPRAKVDVLIPLGLIPWVVKAPAYLMLLLWFGLQILGGFVADLSQGGVAFWAHAGGFITGLVIVGLLRSLGWPVRRAAGHPDHPPADYRRAVRRAGPWD